MSPRRTSGRERREMLLVSIHEVAEGTTRAVAYEDIVVTAWALFPREFGLRGYVNEHPDSADVRRRLYGPLRREGCIRVERGKFALTEVGLAVAECLRQPTPAASPALAQPSRQ
jgi:hypothetical protein